MIKLYKYTVAGSAAHGQVWEVSGNVECQFVQVNDRVMRDVFEKLTMGKAIYGNPGIGCNGPYDIHKILIEQVKH